MKQKLFLVTVLTVAFVLAAAMPVIGNSANDYKIIKNAVKGKSSSSEITWFRLEIKDLKDKKVTLKLKVPIALVDLLSDSIDDEICIGRDKKNIDFKKMLKVLKKNGPTTLLEVTDEDAVLRIWFE
jgi:hypothetical protein